MEIEPAKNGEDVIVADTNGDGDLGTEDRSSSPEVSSDDKLPGIIFSNLNHLSTDQS